MNKTGRPSKIQTLYFFIAGLVLTLGYSNCGLPFNAVPEESVSASSRNVCEGDLIAAFKSSYYPLITTNCAGCHNDSGIAPLKLASSDQNLAYNSFRQATETLVATNAVDPNHASGKTGPALQAVVTAAHAAWQPSYDSYNSCLASGAAGAGTGDSYDLKEQNFPNLYFQDNQVVTAQWDLALDGTPVANRFPGVFSMDVQVTYATVAGVKQPSGYTFTNPRVQMYTGEKEAEIEGIVVRVNGAKLAGMERFLSARSVARRIDPVIFYNGSVSATLPTLLSSDRISVSFGFLDLRARTDALVIPPNPKLTLANPFTRSAMINLSSTNDSTARMWCLTTVPRAPASTADACPGYENNKLTNGWSMSRPKSFNLADMGPLPGDSVSTPVYLWIANSDLKINPGTTSANVTVDNVAPIAPVLTASLAPNMPVADINIPDTNEVIAGWCIKESQNQSDITTNFACSSFQSTKPTALGLASGGRRYIRAVVMDRAGNMTNTNTVFVDNGFSQITFTQLIDASLGTRAVIANRCNSCHGTGAPANSQWKSALLSEGNTIAHASYVDTFAKIPQMKQDSGLTSLAPTAPGHTGLVLSDRETALMKSWLTPALPAE